MRYLTSVVFIVCLLHSTSSYAQQTLTFSSFNLGVITKINMRILEEVYRRLGIKIVIKQYPAERALHLANNGEVDGEFARRAIIMQIAPNLLQIPTALIQGQVTAFSKHKVFKIKGWKSLQPYKVAILRGHKIAEANTRQFNREIINTREALFYFLQQDRADIVIYSYLSGIIFLKKNGLSNIYPHSPPLDTGSIYHFLHKKHADLVPKVDKIIQEIIKEGLPEKITQDILAETN